MDDNQVAPFGVATFLEARTKRPDCPLSHFTRAEQPQGRALLCFCPGWPCRRQADQCNKLASLHWRLDVSMTVVEFQHSYRGCIPYSITSSARASNVGGTMMPSALAVLRLITSLNLVDCSTGRSADD